MAIEDEMNKQLALTSRKEENEAQELVKITTYIREDQAVALEMIENAMRYGLGVNFDRATLIQEALDLLIEKHIVGIDFRKKKIKIIERP